MKLASGATSAAVSISDSTRGTCTFQWDAAAGDWTLVGDHANSPYKCDLKQGAAYLNSHYSTSTSGWVVKTSGW